MSRLHTLLSMLLVTVVLTSAVGRVAAQRECATVHDVTCHQTSFVLTCSCCAVGDPGSQPGLAQDRTEIVADQQATVANLAVCIDACQHATPLAQFDASPPHRSSIDLFVYLADLRL